jgi:hypothetical protein
MDAVICSAACENASAASDVLTVVFIAMWSLPCCWIADMRSDVQAIFKETPHDKQVMMFSATLAKDIRAVCKKFMNKVRPGEQGCCGLSDLDSCNALYSSSKPCNVPAAAAAAAA